MAKERKPKPSEIVDAMLAGKQDPKYDVNKDGKVDIHDVTAAIDEELKPEPDTDPEPEEGMFDVNGVTFRMVKVEAGKFLMGASVEPSAYSFERPQHEVTISKDFFIGETPVTQALWKAVMGSNPSLIKGDDNPVERVTWFDCIDFIKRLNELTGQQFRLPTEAEWEFAAIGGNSSKGYKFSGSDLIEEVAWCKVNAGGGTHPVKEKQPNELGIYDMSGNVNEWVEDWYASYNAAAVTDPKGPNTGSYRVYRGGGFQAPAADCRCHYRYMMIPQKRAEYLGLRIAL